MTFDHSAFKPQTDKKSTNIKQYLSKTEYVTEIPITNKYKNIFTHCM